MKKKDTILRPSVVCYTVETARNTLDSMWLVRACPKVTLASVNGSYAKAAKGENGDQKIGAFRKMSVLFTTYDVRTRQMCY